MGRSRSLAQSQPGSRQQQQQQQYRRRMHAVEQSEEEDDMFIGTLSMEHDRHISVIEAAVTETEN